MQRRDFLRGAGSLTVLGALGTAGCVSYLPVPDGKATPVRYTEVHGEGDVPDDAVAVAEDARPKVIAIQLTQSDAPEMAGGAFGTGWFIDESHVVTNSHVVEGYDEFVGWTFDGESFDMSLVDRVDDYDDSGVDVALLETDFSGRPFRTKSDPDLSQGQRLIHIGHPSGMGFWTMSIGEYVAEDEWSNNYLTTIPGDQGSSGSPVIDMEGDVVGLTTGSQFGEATIETRDDGSPVPEDPVLYDEFPRYKYTEHVPMEDVDWKLSEWL